MEVQKDRDERRARDELLEKQTVQTNKPADEESNEASSRLDDAELSLGDVVDGDSSHESPPSSSGTKRKMEDI